MSMVVTHCLFVTLIADFHKDLSRYSYGKYYNEAEPDLTAAEWKSQFWGDDIYNKLMVIKKKWDPQNTFTCPECLGFDWVPPKKSADAVVG